MRSRSSPPPILVNLRKAAKTAANKAERRRFRDYGPLGRPWSDAAFLIRELEATQDGDAAVKMTPKGMRKFLRGETNDMSLANACAIARAVGASLTLQS